MIIGRVRLKKMLFPKDIIWLLMTKYFHLRDALSCLSASNIFLCGRNPDECRKELVRFNLCRGQRNHFNRKLLELKENEDKYKHPHRCQYCGLRYRRTNTSHVAKCKEIFVPTQEPLCKWCGCEYPTWKGSPHYEKWGRYRCALAPAKCFLFGISKPPCFPNACTIVGCQQFVLHHNCKTRLCAVCNERVHSRSEIIDHECSMN